MMRSIFSSLDRRQFDEAREDRLRRDAVIDAAAFEVQLPHHLAHRGRDLCVARRLVAGFREDFAQAITGENHAAIRLRAEFRQADGLRPEV